MENPTTTIKSFWEKPEGFTGMLFGMGVLGLIGWGLFLALPTIIVFASECYLGYCAWSGCSSYAHNSFRPS